MIKNENFVYSHIRRHPFAFAGILIAGLINSCISFLLPVSVGEFFSIHFHTGGTKSKILSLLGLHIHTLQGFFIFFLALLIIKPIVNYWESIGTYRQGELFVKDLRELAFASQMNWEKEHLSKRAYGKYLLRYSNDMKAVQSYLSNGILGGIKNTVFLLTGLGLLSIIHLRVTLLLSSLFLLVIAIIYFAAAYQKPFITAARSSRSSLLAFVAKSFSRFEKIVMRNDNEETIRNFIRRSDKLYHANMRSNRIESFLQSGTSFLIYGMIGLLLWQMTMPFVHISSPEALMIILIILMMRGAMVKILKVPGYLNKGKISLEKIRQIMVKEMEPGNAPQISDTI